MRQAGSMRPLYLFFAGCFGFFTGGLGFGVITVMLRGPFLLALPVGVLVGGLSTWLLYRRIEREMGGEIETDESSGREVGGPNGPGGAGA